MELQRKAFEALGRADYASAEKYLRRQLDLEPTSFIVLYNLACVRSLQNDAKEGFAFLQRAIEHGFIDLEGMQRDPMLRRVRETLDYQAVISGWDKVLLASRDANVKRTRDAFSGCRQVEYDERLRLAYVNAFNEFSFADAREEMTLLADWADASVFPGILAPDASVNDSWTVVVLPNRQDFAKWAKATFGPDVLTGLSTVGGAYSNDDKRLVAQDLGPTLRHEFFHVLHWRSSSRSNQHHPAWIQEGLCSLVEDYDLISGKIVPSTSWRTNTVQRMDSAGLLLPIRQLVTKTTEHFQGERRMGLYAQSRALFLFLWQRDKLKDWYARYTKEFSEDPSGLLSLERTLGMKAEQIDRAFKEWARSLDQVPEDMKPGMASLGVEVDNGTGEGPVIRSFQKRSKPSGQTAPAIQPQRTRPGRAPTVNPTTKPNPSPNPGDDPTAAPPARQGDNDPKDLVNRMEPGDILTAIDGQPVRDLPELLRRLGKLRPGQTVGITVRRVKLRKTIDVTLTEFR